jgi:hypothetical protein
LDIYVLGNGMYDDWLLLALFLPRTSSPQHALVKTSQTLGWFLGFQQRRSGKPAVLGTSTILMI